MWPYPPTLQIQMRLKSITKADALQSQAGPIRPSMRRSLEAIPAQAPACGARAMAAKGFAERARTAGQCLRTVIILMASSPRVVLRLFVSYPGLPPERLSQGYTAPES